MQIIKLYLQNQKIWGWCLAISVLTSLLDDSETLSLTPKLRFGNHCSWMLGYQQISLPWSTPVSSTPACTVNFQHAFFLRIWHRRDHKISKEDHEEGIQKLKQTEEKKQNKQTKKNKKKPQKPPQNPEMCDTEESRRNFKNYKWCLQKVKERDWIHETRNDVKDKGTTGKKRKRSLEMKVCLLKLKTTTTTTKNLRKSYMWRSSKLRWSTV